MLRYLPCWRFWRGRNRRWKKSSSSAPWWLHRMWTMHPGLPNRCNSAGRRLSLTFACLIVVKFIKGVLSLNIWILEMYVVSGRLWRSNLLFQYRSISITVILCFFSRQNTFSYQIISSFVFSLLFISFICILLHIFRNPNTTKQEALYLCQRSSSFFFLSLKAWNTHSVGLF